MRDEAHTPRGRARPVADAPVAALVGRSDALAREWLLALVASAPLASAAAVPVATLAAEAPGLCAAMARALADDGALAELERSPAAARAGALAGARDPASAAAAVEALRGVLWSEALAELRHPPPPLIADLAARLALVAATVTAATLRASTGTAAVGQPDTLGAGPRDEAETAAAPPPTAAGEREPYAAPSAAPRDAAPPPPSAAAPPPPTGSSEPPLPPPGHEPQADSSLDALDALWTAPAAGAARAVEEAVGEGELRARDLRPRIVAGDPIELLQGAVDAHLDDRRTLAVLLVELDGIDRLLAAQYDGEVSDAVERAEHAVETLLRPGDAARRDADQRLWIALAGTGPAGARALALRVAAAVERAADHRGTPLTASVGVAVFPVDATDAQGLADHAEDALFTARATGSRGGPPPNA